MREWRIPILNACSAGALRYGSLFKVRSVTAREVDAWKNDATIRDIVPHRVLPEIRSVLVCQDSRIDSRGEENLDEALIVWLASSTLYSGHSPVEVAFVQTWDRPKASRYDGGEPIELKLFPLSLPVSLALPWHGAMRLERGRRMVTMALKRFASRHAHAGALRFALARWYQSLNTQRRTLEDAVVDLAIALEAVFISQDERGDKESLLTPRISSFWFQTDPTASNNKKKSFQWKVRQAYKIRSRVVHGAIVELEELKLARNVLDSVLRELFADFIGGYLTDFRLFYELDPKLKSDPAGL